MAEEYWFVSNGHCCVVWRFDKRTAGMEDGMAKAIIEGIQEPSVAARLRSDMKMNDEEWKTFISEMESKARSMVEVVNE